MIAVRLKLRVLKIWPDNLPRMLNLSQAEKAALWCFMTVGLTDVKQQQNLKGVLNENPNCPPVFVR